MHIAEEDAQRSAEQKKRVFKWPRYSHKLRESAVGGGVIGLFLLLAAHIPVFDNPDALKALHKFLDEATTPAKAIFWPVLVSYMATLAFAGKAVRGLKVADFCATWLVRPAMSVCLDFSTTAAGAFLPLSLPLWPRAPATWEGPAITLVAMVMPAMVGAMLFYGADLSESLTEGDTTEGARKAANWLGNAGLVAFALYGIWYGIELLVQRAAV